MIMVYIAILIVITMLTSGSYQDTYSKTALNIGIVKNEESQFADALIDYLDRENNLYYYDSQEAAELDFTLALLTALSKFLPVQKKLCWRQRMPR